jgi:hypothetical protein
MGVLFRALYVYTAKQGCDPIWSTCSRCVICDFVYLIGLATNLLQILLCCCKANHIAGTVLNRAVNSLPLLFVKYNILC